MMAFGTIGIGEPWCTNLKEVMRAIADQYDGDKEIVNVHRYAARCIVNDYLNEFDDDMFSHTEKGNQITYLGGDSIKSSSVAVDNEETDDDNDNKLPFLEVTAGIHTDLEEDIEVINSWEKEA